MAPNSLLIPHLPLQASPDDWQARPAWRSDHPWRGGGWTIPCQLDLSDFAVLGKGAWAHPPLGLGSNGGTSPQLLLPGQPYPCCGAKASWQEALGLHTKGVISCHQGIRTKGATLSVARPFLCESLLPEKLLLQSFLKWKPFHLLPLWPRATSFSLLHFLFGVQIIQTEEEQSLGEIFSFFLELFLFISCTDLTYWLTCVPHENPSIGWEN